MDSKTTVGNVPGRSFTHLTTVGNVPGRGFAPRTAVMRHRVLPCKGEVPGLPGGGGWCRLAGCFQSPSVSASAATSPLQGRMGWRNVFTINQTQHPL